MGLWDYDSWASGAPYDWGQAVRGDSEYDNIDFHVDLGCGKLKKARIGIDRFPTPGVNICMDLDRMILFGASYGADRDVSPHACNDGNHVPGLPFEDDSIKSVVTHHFLEHVGDGFVHLIDEVHRVLEPGGIFRAITPLFPSRTAVEDPDHRRYFMEGTWETFCGAANGEHWHESFSHPYTSSRFEMLEQICTPPPLLREGEAPDVWGVHGAREIRVALRKR